MTHTEKLKQLLAEVQTILDRLELGTLVSLSHTSENLVEIGEFYEYGFINGIKKKGSA